MLCEKIEKELNNQLNRELFSSYLYTAMGAYFVSRDMTGFAHWMHVQAHEEMSHAQKIYNYINERGARVILEQIEKPQSDWEGVLDVFQNTLKHEEYVTSSINDIVNTALEEKDHATHIFLQWFVTEQVEEEASVSEIINKLKLMKDAPGAIFMLDRELGQRQLSSAEA